MTSTTDNRRRALAASEGSAVAGAEGLGTDGAPAHFHTAETCEDKRLLDASYKVCGSNADRDWHFRPPGGPWFDGFRSERAAARAALRHLAKLPALATPPSDSGRGAASQLQRSKTLWALHNALGKQNPEIELCGGDKVWLPANWAQGCTLSLGPLVDAVELALADDQSLVKAAQDLLALWNEHGDRYNPFELTTDLDDKMGRLETALLGGPMAADAGRGDREAAVAHRGTSVVNAGVVISPSGRKLCTTPTYEAAQEVAAAWNAANG